MNIDSLSIENFFGNTLSLEDITMTTEEQHQQDIKHVMADVMGSTRITERLCHDIDYYLQAFVNKDEEHINFFGSNLTGVDLITFTSDDRNSFTTEVINVDEFEIRRRVKAIPHIGSDWVRGTDGINLSLIYLTHLIHNSSIKDTLKQKAITQCLIILQAKFLSSLLNAYFKYPISEGLAMAVYDEVSKKFYIKKYGTWYKLLEARAIDIYDKNSTHRKTIETFAPDKMIQYMITDTQTRIKSMILNIYEVTMRLNSRGAGTKTGASMWENDGTLEVKDIERHFEEYHNYLTKVAQEPRAFIKQELIDVISESITTMPAKLLHDMLMVLTSMSQKHDKDLAHQYQEILIYTFDYFKQNKRDVKDLSNLGKLIVTLKSLFTASKTNSKTVLELRDYFDKLVKKNVKSKNPATIAGVRTGIILYVILRTLTKNHYG